MRECAHYIKLTKNLFCHVSLINYVAGRQQVEDKLI
jgi:hypothetical protein